MVTPVHVFQIFAFILFLLFLLFFFSNNLVFLQIGYKSLSYELHEQKEAFGLQALLGNFCLFLSGL